eukprot:108404_1
MQLNVACAYSRVRNIQLITLSSSHIRVQYIQLIQLRLTFPIHFSFKQLCHVDFTMPSFNRLAMVIMFTITTLLIICFALHTLLKCNTNACVEDLDCCEVNKMIGVNGVLVKSTPKSYNALPDALDIAAITVEYVTSSFKSINYKYSMQGHVVYVYHGDPSLATGLDLQPKDIQYDYLTDMYNLTTPTPDGRSWDEVYGLGGVFDGNPTSILDCNLLISCTEDRHKLESILLHEFGHAIQDIGLLRSDYPLWNRTKNEVYNNYIHNVSTAAASYCGSNYQEMWACAVQVWFIGTLRADIAPGMYTIHLMYQNVPSLYDALFRVFGEPVHNIIYALSDVRKMPLRPHWLYYDTYITEYGADALKSHWDNIKQIGFNETVETCDDNWTHYSPINFCIGIVLLVLFFTVLFGSFVIVLCLY